MRDWTDVPNVEWARKRNLEIRAEIRKRNHMCPRCAGCGNYMPVFNIERDVVTEERMATPGYDYLKYLDYRPGDLVCYWCIFGESTRAGII